MSNDEGHGYGWEDLRRTPVRELAVGDVWVSPAAFAAYREGKDGRVTGTFGYEGPRGTAWTLTARDGDTITARSHDGIEVTETVPTGERVTVLRVVPPEPVGTVLAVNSHRARARLERALGRSPAAYYDTAMRRGGKFVVLYGEDVDTALGITSVTRTRLKPDDVALCIGNGDEFDRRDTDRAAGRKTEGVAG